MVDVTRGLIGRRVCGSIELVFGVLLVLGAIQSFDIVSILSALLIILTGILGIASSQRGVVIAYLVTGIICAILLLVTVILSVVVIIAYHDDINYLDSSGTALTILIVVVVIVALGLIVVVLGVVFACLPLCGNSEGQGAVQYQHNTSPNIVGPPGYNYGNTAYPVPMQGPPTNNFSNTGYPVTMQGPPTNNFSNTGYPVTMQGPPLQDYGNTAYPGIKQGPV